MKVLPFPAHRAGPSSPETQRRAAEARIAEILRAPDNQAVPSRLERVMERLEAVLIRIETVIADFRREN